LDRIDWPTSSFLHVKMFSRIRLEPYFRNRQIRRFVSCSHFLYLFNLLHVFLTNLTPCPSFPSSCWITIPQRKKDGNKFDTWSYRWVFFFYFFFFFLSFFPFLCGQAPCFEFEPLLLWFLFLCIINAIWHVIGTPLYLLFVLRVSSHTRFGFLPHDLKCAPRRAFIIPTSSSSSSLLPFLALFLIAVYFFLLYDTYPASFFYMNRSLRWRDGVGRAIFTSCFHICVYPSLAIFCGSSYIYIPTN